MRDNQSLALRVSFRFCLGDQPDPDQLRICASLASKPSKKITDLFVNITTHVATPKHEILSTEENEQLLIKYKLSNKQLPYTLESDAFSRYYGREETGGEVHV
ncbi:DNA-directed RNA polymerase V subunit 5C-like [Rutidosis leptorrhynchoides]|uniref:DNA-directed RNA polymerase V subunit 5C-like n=1 Tax=Rutidosis leptorrhynchoides TaxID=125765 RepID=UPI003A9A63E8